MSTPNMFGLIDELRGFAEGSTSARASLMRDAADAIESLLDGTYEGYRQLGEDTDGARNAHELFAPMTDVSNPAKYLAHLINRNRAEYEDAEPVTIVLNPKPTSGVYLAGPQGRAVGQSRMTSCELRGP